MKILYILVISISSLSSIFLLACRKNVENPGLSKYYPNDVGDTWQYDVTDSAQSTPNNPTLPIHYSVKVSIVGTRILPDGRESSVWQYQYPSGNDTNYVRLKGDTVQVFGSSAATSLSKLNFPDVIFLIPFQNNQHWTGKIYGSDNFATLGQTTMSYAGQTFAGCYDIFRHYLGPNTELNDHYFFKPYVGIIGQKFSHYINSPILYQSWQLKNFSVH